MDNNFTPDLITLIDDENNEHNFEILDVIEDDRGVFYALYPIFDDAQDAVDDCGEYYIMEVIEENGEQQLAEIEDDDLLNSLAEVFEQHFDEIFSDDGTEEN